MVSVEIDALLRVPCLYLLDYILVYHSGYFLDSHFVNASHENNTSIFNPSKLTSKIQTVFLSGLNFLFLVIIALTILYVMTWTISNLKRLYCALGTAALMSFGYVNVIQVAQLPQTENFGYLSILVILLDAEHYKFFLIHILMGLCFSWLLPHCFPKPLSRKKDTFFLFYSLSIFIQVFLHDINVAFSAIILPSVPILMGLLSNRVEMIEFMKKNLHNISEFLHGHFQPDFNEVFMDYWVIPQTPFVFRLFWVSRLIITAFVIGTKRYFQLENSFKVVNESAQFMGLAYELKAISDQVLVRGCDSTLTVLGMCATIATVMEVFGGLMQYFIGSDNDEDRSMGLVSAVLFFVLALQNGLTGLDPASRLLRLQRNGCLLFVAILHFIHGMCSPVMEKLSASHNRDLIRHLRALTVCMALIILPIILMFILWKNNEMSTWLLAVTAFSTEVVLKVILLLAVYILFIIDSFISGFWVELDDYIYYVRSAGHTVEFIFGLFLFCNGTWILLFEVGGKIRAIMLCIHAYSNIWMQAKRGWRVFINRRTAARKINSFPDSDPVDLKQLDDICAICQLPLISAKKTPCSHHFHSLCLRKWLYIQDTCPLCHNSLSVVSNVG